MLAFLVISLLGQDRVSMPGQNLLGRTTVYCENWDLAGRCITTIIKSDGGTFGGGGSTYNGSAAIDVTGTTISCLEAGATDAGCLTAGTQTIAGTKTFSGVTIMQGYQSVEGALTHQGRLTSEFVTNDLRLGGYLRSRLDGTGLTFSSLRTNSDTGPDFVFRPEQRRDAGSMISAVDGQNAEFLSLGNNGRLTLSCANNDQLADCGGIWDGNTNSGHVFIHSAAGLYLGMEGRMPLYYWGQHGAVTLWNSNPMMAGYLFELNNPDSVGDSNKKFMVTFQGGVVQQGGYNYSSEPFLQPCDGATDHPVNDGGPGYYIATDAGQAPPGTDIYVKDMDRHCYCSLTNLDGGPRAGWKRYDKQGCNVP